MKHPRLWPVLLALVVLLTGCNPRSSSKVETPHVTGFSCSAAGTYREEAVAGTLTRSAAGLLTVTLSEPSSLDGLTMTWNGENVKLRMLGIEWSISPDAIPQAALGVRILQSLDAVVHGEGEGERTADGRLRTTGTAGDAAFTLYSDPATGALLSLEVPSEELTLTFSDFRPLTAD